MPKVRPFAALHYAPTPALSRRVAPPYDVISPTEQDALYEADPANFVRAILNRATPHDTPADSPYTRAARHLRDWRCDGTLVERREPAFYVYRQRFADPRDGTARTRTGLFVSLELSPYAEGQVLPHEETRPRARADRLELMRATSANTEPILLLYQDPGLAFASRIDGPTRGRPLLEAEVAGDLHQVWCIEDADAAADIQRFFDDRRLWIADGHHRYETALAYAAERDLADPGHVEAPWRSMMVVLTAFEDPGLVVLPTHRIVTGIAPGRAAGLRAALTPTFEPRDIAASELPAHLAQSNAGPEVAFGCVTREWSGLAVLRDAQAMRRAAPDKSNAWRGLDVAVLQAIVFGEILGIDAAEVATGTKVGYTRDAADAVERVTAGDAHAAFLLGPPSPDALLGVTAAGDKMPAKSTFFYPKLWSGLLLRRLDG